MNTEKTSLGNESQPSCLGAVCGSKSEQITKTKELFEKGLIFFDPKKTKITENLIISCDFGNGKDYSSEHIFYYR